MYCFSWFDIYVDVEKYLPGAVFSSIIWTAFYPTYKKNINVLKNNSYNVFFKGQTCGGSAIVKTFNKSKGGKARKQV